MARIFITGSSDGIGLQAARHLADAGHQVYLHARSAQRAADCRAALPNAAGVLVGDLSSLSSTKALAESADAAGPFDAIVHNAGMGFVTGNNSRTPEGLPAMFQVNVLAPYVLTALMRPPTRRMLFMSSGMHRQADTSVEDLGWRDREMDHMKAYLDTKFHDILLAKAVARRWEGKVDVVSWEPGWIATKLGGGGPGDAVQAGRRLADWAEGKLLEGKTGVHITGSGVSKPVSQADDEKLQEKLMHFCADASGIQL